MFLEYINGWIIKVYNCLMRMHIININHKAIRRIRAALYHNICYKCNASFGKENPDRIFYVIRCPQSEMGLFAVINFVIFHIEKAVACGAEPVVDWQYYPNKYFSDDEKVGKENVWEYFFESVSGISLEEVYKSKHVIMSNGEWIPDLSETLDDEKLWKMHQLVEKYIRLNENTKRILKKECERIGIGKERVLGVKCRGTDFAASRPVGHAIVPDVDMTINVIEEKIKIWGDYDKIYLSTEDADILEKMKKHYGDRLFFTDAKNFTNVEAGKWLGDLYNEVTGEKKKEDMCMYIVATYLLASCDALIAPMVGGTLGAMRIKGKYKNKYIFNLGNY